MRIMYEANDGTLFEDENECLDYEEKQLSFEPFFVELKGKWIWISNDEQWNKVKHECFNLFTETQESLDSVANLMAEEGFTLDGLSTGYCIYNDKDDSWTNLEKEYIRIGVQLQNAMDKLEAYMEKEGL